MSLSEQLIALHDLHVRGLLTDDQFSLAKTRVIASNGEAGANAAVPPAAIPPIAPPPPLPPPPAPVPTLNPVVPGVGLALGAAAMANGGLTG